jgi:uroporphyrin-III C-methyltransferase / precorrin-2 dehydrogenase / sirohydrochlorin ferrochelatase
VSASPDGPALLPVFLKLGGRRVLLVGGGTVARGKLAGLLEAGARVTVVAPEVRPEIEAADVTVLPRAFRSADLDGAWLVVAAAPPEVNREVAAAAEDRGVFVNAVDDPAPASAYTGGVFRRGGITIAVSTGGRAPALAGLLREALEAIVPEDVALWVDEARRLRERQKAEGVPMSRRRPLLLEALNRLYAGRAAERVESTGTPAVGPAAPAPESAREART